MISRNAILCITILLHLPTVPMLTLATPRKAMPVNPGEKLIYNLRYMRMDIATVTFHVLEPVDTLGTTLYHVRAEINSNPRLPIIKVKDVFDTYFDEQFRPYFCNEKGFTQRHIYRIFSQTDFNQSQVYVQEFRQKGRKEKLHKEYRHEISARTFDTLTLLFYLRNQAKLLFLAEQQQFSLYNRSLLAKITCNPGGKERTITRLKRDFAAMPIKLDLGKKKIAGMRDDIEILFSLDANPLPLSAEVKLFLGKVQVDLVEYQPGIYDYASSLAGPYAGEGKAEQ